MPRILSKDSGAEFHLWRANALVNEQRIPEALSHVMYGLDIERDRRELLVLAGELYLFYHDELRMESPAAFAEALRLFDRVIELEPRQAEAWSGKALTLIYMDQPEEALCAAERGLAELRSCVGYGMAYGPVHTNVAEGLFDRKIRALLMLGRPSDARESLSAGLEYCPGSRYLSRHITACVLPDVEPEPGPTETRLL